MEEEIQKSLASFEGSENEKKTMEDILWSMTNYLRLEEEEFFFYRKIRTFLKIVKFNNYFRYINLFRNIKK